MQTERAEKFGQKKKRFSFKWAVISAAGLVVACLIFNMGFMLGRGNLTFSSISQNKDLPNNLDYSSVEDVYDNLKANYDGNLDSAKLLDGMKAGLAKAAGDPYTIYMNAKDADAFNNQLNGTFSGVGAELGQDGSGNLIIVAPIKGFPADKAGLRAQDVIVSIDGKSASGMSVEDAVTKIRGKKGTQVKLRVLRDKKEDLSFTITRDDIKIPSVKYEILDGNVGYMQINQFGDDTADLARQGAEEFKAKGVKGVILDLRGNPGGLLDAAVDVSSLWLPEGSTILQEKRGGVVVSTSYAKGGDVLNGMKTAVLIDAGSASASEITAGALKDNNAATLFGVKSFGKGSVQQIQRLPGGAELKVTIARWYRPNGQNIDKKGINADHEVKMTDDDYKNKRDPQKDAAIDFIKN